MRSLIRAALFATLPGLLLAGCATTTTETLKVEVKVLDALTRYEAAYLLQPGDQIEVFVYRHADLSRKLVIRPDGFISLPLLGEVKAGGKAPRELNEELVKLFAVRIVNPEVTVIVENPIEPMVFVLGDVSAPKAVPLRQARTAAQALSMSGNAAKTGEMFGISIIRLNKEGFLEAHNVTTEGYSQPEVMMALHNMPLQANDLVFVPESYRGQIVRLITDVNSMLLPYYQLRILQFIKP